MKNLLVLAFLLLMAQPARSTTIAWDSKTIAFDSQRSGGSHNKSFVSDKAVRSDKRKATLAAGGEVRITSKIKKFFLETEEPLSEFPLPPQLEPGTFMLLVVYDNGVAEVYGDDLKNPDIVEAPYAFGTGGDFALAMMHIGKSAKEAVELAAEMDLYTGGPIRVLEAPKPTNK